MCFCLAAISCWSVSAGGVGGLWFSLGPANMPLLFKHVRRRFCFCSFVQLRFSMGCSGQIHALYCRWIVFISSFGPGGPGLRFSSIFGYICLAKLSVNLHYAFCAHKSVLVTAVVFSNFSFAVICRRFEVRKAGGDPLARPTHPSFFNLCFLRCFWRFFRFGASGVVKSWWCSLGPAYTPLSFQLMLLALLSEGFLQLRFSILEMGRANCCAFIFLATFSFVFSLFLKFFKFFNFLNFY